MKKILSLVLALALLPALTQAAEIKTGNRYFLPMEEIFSGNLYVASGEATVAGTVDGDLYIGAGTALVSGVVTDDLVVAGGTVNITGEIDGDLRIIGGNAVVTGPVRGDIFVIGGSLTTGGTVDGDVDFIGGVLNVSDGAVIDGDLTYRSDREAVISPKARIAGQVVYDKTLARSIGVVKEAGAKSMVSGFAALFGVWIFLKLLMMLFAAMVLYWLFLPYLEKVVMRALGKPWPMLATGFIALVVTPAVALVLAVSIVGLPLAFITGFIYLAFLAVAKLSAGALLGAWGEKVLTKRANYRISWQGVLGGTVIFFALSYLPIIGWLIDGVAVLIVFGAVIDLLYRRWLAR